MAAKFFSRLFSGSSSSSKRPPLRGSQTSINEAGRRTGTAANIRAATSLDNISSYHVNPKELEKNKLHKASWEGNLQKVERLAGPGQINMKDQHLRTPLHLAIVRGHLDVVRYLVHEGAKLDVIDNEQRTPLVKAVLSGNQNHQLYYHICTVLLNGGADTFINAVDIHGKNALHYAIDYGNENLVDLFLSYPNCDPNFRDRDQMTPTHLAVKRNNPNIIHLLLSDQLQTPADANLVNRNGQTPLHMAAAAGYVEVIRALLQANLEDPCDPTILDSHQLTAQQLAKTNNQEIAAKLINEYEQGWTNLSPRRASESIDEHEIRPVVMNPAGQLDDDDESESSEHTSSNQSSEPSEPIHREGRSLADMIKNNPLQPEINKPNISKPANQTLSSLIQQVPVQPTNQTLSSPVHNVPLQSDLNKANLIKPNDQGISNLVRNVVLQPDANTTNVSKPTNQTLSSLIHHLPVQPNETSPNKSVISQPKQPTSIYGIGPVGLQNRDSDNTSSSISIEKTIINANPLIGQPASSPPKNTTINSLINSLPKPELTGSNSNSWAQDTSQIHKQDHTVKKAERIEHWDDSSTTQSDDDDTGIYRIKPPLTNYPNQDKTPALNGTAMFTTTPTKYSVNDSKSEDEDSIEAAVQKFNTQKASGGVQNLVNQQIGKNFMIPQQSSIPDLQSPRSEASSWSTSSVTANKGINSLVQQQPILAKKTNDTSWDDSRPLSADLNRNSIKPQKTLTSSYDSDDDPDKKSSTIVKSPLTHLIQPNVRPTETTSGVLSHLVQSNMRPTETTGVENLTKIIDAVKTHPVTHTQKQSPPPKSINHIVATPLLERDDSSSSNESSLIDDTIRTSTKPITIITSLKQPLYHDEADEHHWPGMSNDRNDYRIIARKYSNEMASPSQRQASRASIHQDFNNLRGSMSSSTSSIQNNMERISELKEDIKQIERKQEDSLELKRQLKDMEIKKNNFEALYKKNDQLLRETETKLEKEINEKQRLEWTTKNLNMELKSVKQKLQSLEDEKDILNQRCLKLKEERDIYDEKYRIHQANTLQTAASGILREEDIEKIKIRHREEMKLLSAENDDLHQRTRQLQSDLQLHKESLDVTIRYKIDLEKALEEKTFLQHELDRLKHEKDYIEQEKFDYKTKYDNLQEEIRVILSDRSKIEQKLTNELQDQIKQRQRSTDDGKKYRTQIEQLNLKLGDAEARLLVLQTQNEALLASKDREIKHEFESLTHRLNMIETEKLNAEQRYQNEHKEITNKQQQVLHEPLVILTSTPLSNSVHHQHSPSSPCLKCNTLQRSYEQEREQRLQTERDNERLRDTVSRQKHEHEYQQGNVENSRQMRTETDRVKYELDRLRHDFDKLVLNYTPPNNTQQQAQLHSQIDTLRQFYEQEFRQQQLLLSKLANGIQPTTNGVYHHPPAPLPQRYFEHSHPHNGGFQDCSTCSNSRLLKERLDNAIDTSLADQRIQTIKQMPILPRQTSSSMTPNISTPSTADLLRKRYYI